MNFEGDSAGDLIMLARGVVRGGNVDPHQLCRAAIAVMDNPPKDEQLAAIADHLCRAAMDWAEFDGPQQKLAAAVQAYLMASSALEADELKRNHEKLNVVATPTT
jgi:hypothetical protein